MGLDSITGGSPRNKGEAYEGPIAAGSPSGLRKFISETKQDDRDIQAEEKSATRAFEGGKKEVFESAGISTYTDPQEGLQPKVSLDPSTGISRLERPEAEFSVQRRLPTGELVDDTLKTDKYGGAKDRSAKRRSLIVGKDASSDPRTPKSGIYEEFEDPRQPDAKNYKFIGGYEELANSQDLGVRDVARKGLLEQNQKASSLLSSELQTQIDEVELKERELRDMEAASKTTGELPIFDGKQLQPEESAKTRLGLQQQVTDLKKQRVALKQIEKQGVAMDLLRQAKERALREGKNPSDDPVVRSLEETYRTLGRETPEEAFMAKPDQVAVAGGRGTVMVEGATPDVPAQQNSAFFRTAGNDLRSKLKIEQEAGSSAVEKAKLSIKAQEDYNQASKEILPAAIRKQTIKQLVDISNRELEEATSKWDEMTPQEQAEFNSRFEGRRQAIQRLGEEYKSLEPAANAASDRVGNIFKTSSEAEKAINDSFQKKTEEITNEANAFAKAQSERASAGIRDEYLKRQANFNAMGQRFGQLAQAGDDTGVVKLAQDYVANGGSQQDADRMLSDYGKYKKSKDGQGWLANSIASFMRAPLVASQESAAGLFKISASGLRAKAAGGDDVMDAIGPAGWLAKVLPSLEGNPALAPVRVASDMAGQAILDKIYQTKAAKPFVEYIADWMDESASSAKGNIESLKKGFYVDPQFEASTAGNFLKGIGDYAWTALPYIALRSKGIPVGMAMNTGRLYTEAREDQEQTYQAKLAEFKAGKIKDEPKPLNEADAHIAALRYAGLGGFIDTVSDAIGMKLAFGMLKGAAAVTPKTLGSFFKRTAVQVGEKKVPMWLTPPLAGATEFGAEGSQKLLLNALAEKYENWDPSRPWNEGAFQEAMMGFMLGFTLPIIGGVGGSIYKKTVVIPSMLMENEGLDNVSGQYQNLSIDVPMGGWRQYADTVTPAQGQENPQFELAARQPFSVQNELRGTGITWAIAVGQRIDSQLVAINSQIQQTKDPAQGKILRLKRNDLLLQRYNLIQAMQGDAALRFSLQNEIGSLPDQPLAKGDASFQQAALAAAKHSVGAPLTKQDLKLKVGGTQLFQQTEDGKTIVSPSFMRFLSGKAPTLESVVANNQNLLDSAPPTTLADQPPVLSEAPAQEDVRAERDQAARQKLEAEQQQPPEPAPTTDQAKPQTGQTWAVPYTKNGKIKGTLTIQAENENKAKQLALKQLKEDGAKTIAFGDVRLAEQQELVGQEPSALLTGPDTQRKRVGGAINPYMRRLEGKNSKERYINARRRLERFAGEARSIFKASIGIREDSESKAAIKASLAEDGTISLVVNPRLFTRLDEKAPEWSNRAFGEEFRHMADFIASNLKANESGRSDYKQFYQEERSRLYQNIFESAKQDQRILNALMSSASVYFGKDGPPIKEGGYTAEEFMEWAESSGISDVTLMGELLQQLNSKRRTEVAAEVAEASARGGGSVTASLMETIKDYLKYILRAINGLRRSLSETNPEVAADLDSLIQSINDVLDMKAGQQEASGPSIDSGTQRRLRDMGLTPAEISNLTPDQAKQRLQGQVQVSGPAQTQGLKSTNTRKTEYGVVRYDLDVVPINELNNMAGTELQLRDRTGDEGYASKVAVIARDWDKDEAASRDTGELDTGPATVIEAKNNPYGVNQAGFDIIAGHGRTEGYSSAPDERVADYVAKLKAKYPELAGKIDAILASGQRPMLVRKIDWQNTFNSSLGTEKQHLRRIARDANLGTGNENDAEIALADALEISDDIDLSLPQEVMVNGQPSLLNQDGTPAGNNDDILARWLRIFSNDSDRRYYQNGVYTPDFEARIRRAILGYVFAPTNEKGEMALTKQTFDTINMLVSPTIARNNGIATLQQGLEKASPSLFRVKQDFQKYEDLLGQDAKDANPIVAIQKSLSDYLAYRAEREQAARKSGDNRAIAMVGLAEYEDYINQSGLFGTISPQQAMVLVPIVRDGKLDGIQGVASPLAKIPNARGIKGSPERIASYIANYSDMVASIYREASEAMLPGLETKLTPDLNLNMIRIALDRAGAIYPDNSKPQAPIFPAKKDPLELAARQPDLFGSTIGETKGSVEIRPEINYSRILNLLGPKMYEKNLVEVSVKELLQNSFDAARAAGATNENPGEVFIRLDPDKRTVSVTDNGVGMTPEIIQKAFFTIAGTHKEQSAENTSGGLGLAKMAFLYGSDSVKVVSVRDGVKSTVLTDRKTLLNRDPINVVTEKTSEPSGTSVEVVIPQTIEDSEGNTKTLYFPQEPAFLSKPLIGPIKVTLAYPPNPYTGAVNKILNLGVNQQDYQKETRFGFSWGNIDVYINPERQKYPTIEILSAGLHQFGLSRYDVFGWQEEGVLPYNIVLDVRPSVKPENAAYPFNNSREGWRGTIKEDVGAMYGYLRRMATEQNLLEAKESFSNLEKMPQFDPQKDLTSDELADIAAARPKPRPTVPIEKPEFVDFSGDNVVIRYSDQSGIKPKEIPKEEYVKQSFKPEKDINFQSAALDVSGMDPRVPLFHNNTNIDLSAQADGGRAKKMFASLGNALSGFMREFGAKVGPNMEPYAALASDGAQGWFSGISIDKEYRGLNMVKPFKSIWFNPAGLSEDAMVSPEAAALETIHVFIHEITHVNARNEGSQFTSELANNYARIRAFGVDDIATERILASIYARHWKDINDLRTKYISYNTKNSARGFQSSSESLRTGTEGGQSNQPQDNPSQPVGNEGQGRGGDSRTGEADSGASLGEIIASRARAERKLLRYPNRYSLSLRARAPDLFESSEEPDSEQDAETGATEESARNAYLVIQEIAPMEGLTRTDQGMKEGRIRPGGKIITYLVNKSDAGGMSVADRFYARGYGEEQLREVIYDKMVDVLSKSASGKQIAKDFLATRVNATSSDLNLYTEARKAFVQRIIRKLLVSGNKNPSVEDIVAEMSDKDRALGFEMRHIVGAREEIRLNNFVMRSVENHVRKLVGNYDQEGKSLIVTSAEARERRPTEIADEDTESMVERKFVNPETGNELDQRADESANLQETLLAESGTAAEVMARYLGPDSLRIIEMKVRGMSFQAIAEEEQLSGHRPDNIARSRFEEAYSKVLNAIDAIYSAKKALESKQILTQEEESKLDDFDVFLSGRLGRGETFESIASARSDAQRAIKESGAGGGQLELELGARTPEILEPRSFESLDYEEAYKDSFKRPVFAVQLNDGTVIADSAWRIHANAVEGYLKLPEDLVQKIVESGFIRNGEWTTKVNEGGSRGGSLSFYYKQNPLPPPRLLAKYFELRDKIKSGEFAPKDVDMFERIESMAIRFGWPIPVQLRLFDIPNITRRLSAEGQQASQALQDEFDFGPTELLSRTPDLMSPDELQEALDGDWITSDEIQAALRDESAGDRRGLVDYGKGSEASAVIRAGREATPSPEPYTNEEAMAKADTISRSQILGRLAGLEAGEVLSKDEDYAAQRELNQLALEAFASEDEKQINDFLYLQRQYDKSGTEAARSLQGRKPFNPDDRRRKAVYTPITAIDRRDLQKEAINQTAKLKADLSIAEDSLNEQKTRARAQFGANLPQEWIDYISQQEAAIAQMKADIEDGGVRVAEREILSRNAQKADQALGKVGKSLKGLEEDNMKKKLRTGQTAGQILESIKDTQLRDAVQLYLLGYSVKDIELQTGIKNGRNKIKLAILKGLRPEADRRFSRVLEMVKAGKMTRKQLMKALKKHSEGQGLLARAPEDPDQDNFTVDEARKMLYDAFGLNTENLENKESDPLFGYDDPHAANRISSIISEGINGPASWGKIASDVFSSFIFTGSPSLVANVSTIPFAKLTVPAHLFVEALTTYYRGAIRGVKMTETVYDKVPTFDEEGNPSGSRIAPKEVEIGSPYQTLGQAISGGLSEAFRAYKELGWLGRDAEAWQKAMTAFTTERIQFGVEQGIVNVSDIRLRESGVLDKSIPGLAGKLVRLGVNTLLAGDEYNKTMRARAYVGAFAYRLAKARGLSGEALDQYVESELSDKGSLAWRLAVDRTLRDTFTQRLSIRGDEELLTPEPLWEKAKGLGRSLRDYQSIGELLGLAPEALTMINMELGKAATRVGRGSSIKVFGRSLSPAELALRFVQSFLILIRSPYNIARASAAYSPLAMANVALRASRGRVANTMNVFDYNALAQRHSEALLGIAGLASLFAFAEGDDDDDKKPILITGSGAVRTKYGNPSTSVIIRTPLGNYVIPYGRYEPVSALAYVADAARSTKQVVKGRQPAPEALGDYVKEFLRYPFTKTFSKAIRDFGKLTGFDNPSDTGKYKGYDVLRERASSILIPNFFKRLFEPGAVTFGDESWDVDRMTGWGPAEMAGWVNSFMPGLPALTGNEDSALPPRYGADLKVRDREITGAEVIAKSAGIPDRASRMIGGLTKGLVPDGLAYVESKKGHLERFVAAYNSRFPQTRYQPKAPNRFIQVKDRDGISSNEEMTPAEYKTMLALASKYAGDRIDNVLTEERISNPTENTRKLVDSIREDAVSRARQAIRNARRAKEKMAVEPAGVR